MATCNAVYFDNGNPFLLAFFDFIDARHEGIQLSRSIPRALERLVISDTMKIVFVRLVGSYDARDTVGGELIKAIREHSDLKYRRTKIITLSSEIIDTSTIPFANDKNFISRFLHFNVPIDSDDFYNATYQENFECPD